ncbi:hypothetical protein JB92DRAFT_2901355 [Gautieria morchelliformis]|nr:hypothetical protein JB92DRAFT_2901355 [Gautieria morchelliformis]
MAPSSPIPPTLLTLRLSSPSFLETVLTNNACPVYATETYGNTTSLSRCDSTNGLTLIANIHWPEHRSTKGKGKESASAQLFIDGSTMTEEDLLKRNCLNTSRKFRIPGHSHSLKWRRVQGVFQCTSSDGTPVAVFEPAILTARARLNVFVSTLSGLACPQPQAQADGVSSILVDYLIVTALFLTTHPEDWRGFSPSTPRVPVPSHTSLPHLSIPASPPQSFPAPQTLASWTPVSPITSAVSESSSSAPWENASEQRRGGAPTESGVSRQSSVSCMNLDLSAELKEAIEYEPPPPYEEIQWTVRVRQPRRPRTG